MKRDGFFLAIRDSIAPGKVYQNPGGGTTQLVAVNPDRVSYARGYSTISVSLDSLYRAYKKFRGRRVSSRDLREFAPEVFDSSARPAGHSCNCTFFFNILQDAGLCGPLGGNGVRGDPYYVDIK